MMLGPVLNLVNGPVVADAVKDPGNRIAKILATTKDDAKAVEELYLAVLCRPPTPAEVQAGLKALRDGEPDYAAQLAEHNKRQADLAAYEKTLPERQAKWEAEVRTPPAWVPVEVVSAASAGGATLSKQGDGSVLASGKNPGPETYTVTARTKLTGISGIRLEVLSDPSLPAKGPGRASNGNLVLNEFKVIARPDRFLGLPLPVRLHRAQADFSQNGWAVAGAIDNNPDSGWAVAPQFGKDHFAVFETQSPLGAAGGTTLTFTLLQRFPGGDHHNIGRFRLSVTTAKTPLTLTGPPEPVAKALRVESAQRTPEQKAELTRHFRSLDSELARLRQAVADAPMPVDKRQPGAQDLVWALLNSKAFQFNH
jgi:hypothetical protein